MPFIRRETVNERSSGIMRNPRWRWRISRSLSVPAKQEKSTDFMKRAMAECDTLDKCQPTLKAALSGMDADL